MDWRLTKEQEDFRQEVRSWLAEILPRFREERDQGTEGEGEGEDSRYSPAFSKELGKKGWIGLAWPKEYGGKALGFIEQAIFNEEMIASRAPCGYHSIGERQIGPSVMRFGTDEQKKSYLPKITRGEIGFALGYTEPNAGSDLAGVETRGHRDGDDWVINGQKMWAGGAQLVDYLWTAVRTNPDAPKHKGVSVFIIPLRNNPGLSIRPLYVMSGARHNEVFFENVRVTAEAMVGEKDRGWYTVAHNLDFERSGIERVAPIIGHWQEIVRYAKEFQTDGGHLADNPIVRYKLADLAIGLQVARDLCYRVAWMQSKGLVPGNQASIAKLHSTEISVRTYQVFAEVLGYYGTLWRESKDAPLKGMVLRKYLDSMSVKIRGGTAEIQRNVIATRGLGLPR